MQHLLENIKEYMDMLEDTQLKETVSELTVTELMEVWDFLNDKEKLRLFLIFDHEMKSDFISELSANDQEFLIIELSEHAGISIFIYAGNNPDRGKLRDPVFHSYDPRSCY